ncbi:hypothetical protein [Deinococcus pimensis]|uniref:hypothetical protein n=1 Tax=Deinococcus pimensis TaxID=309888 RepID=UPI00048A1484|nr:hypothetical protein [Deinococcus pimensis]
MNRPDPLAAATTQLTRAVCAGSAYVLLPAAHARALLAQLDPTCPSPPTQTRARPRFAYGTTVRRLTAAVAAQDLPAVLNDAERALTVIHRAAHQRPMLLLPLDDITRVLLDLRATTTDTRDLQELHAAYRALQPVRPTQTPPELTRDLWRALVRPTEPGATERATWVADILGILRCVLRPPGTRAYFERPRATLGGRSPRDHLGEDWEPNDPAALDIHALARTDARTTRSAP